MVIQRSDCSRRCILGKEDADAARERKGRTAKGEARNVQERHHTDIRMATQIEQTGQTDEADRQLDRQT